MSPSEATFATRSYEGAVVVQARGDLDVSTAPALRRALEDAAASDAPLVVLDLSRTGFLDSAGIAAVLGVKRGLPVEQRLVLASVPQHMLRMLRVAAISHILEVHAQGDPWPFAPVPEPDAS